jgi:hypothetical protein
MTIPYFYIIRHKQSGLLYAGSRWKNGCEPNELLRPNGYYTSSKIVKKLLKEDPDCFEIIHIKFDCSDVKKYETCFLHENDCVKSELWLNGHDNKTLLSHDSDEFKEIMIKLYGVDHWAKTKDGREFHRQQMIAYNNTPEAKAKLTERNKNNNPSKKIENRIKHSIAMKETNERMIKNRTHPSLKPENTESLSQRMKVTMARQPEMKCPYCDLISKNKANMLRWHFDKCKFKK